MQWLKPRALETDAWVGNSLFYFDHVRTSLWLSFLDYKIVVIIGLSTQVVIGST